MLTEKRSFLIKILKASFSLNNCTIKHCKILTTMNSLSLVKNLQGLSFKIHNDKQRCKCCA